MIKASFLLVRRPELSRDEFTRHWTQVHAPHVDAVPGVRRYVQTHILDQTPHPDLPGVGATIDGVADLWFDDRAAFERAMATPEVARLAADGAQFIGRMSILITEERVFIPH